MFNWFKKKYQQRSLFFFLPPYRAELFHEILKKQFEEGTVQRLAPDNYRNVLLNPFNRLYICTVEFDILKQKAMWLNRKHCVLLWFHPVDILLTAYHERMSKMKLALKNDVLYKEMEIKLFRDPLEFSEKLPDDKQFYRAQSGQQKSDYFALIRMDVNLLRDDCKNFCQLSKCDSGLLSSFQKIMLKPQNMDSERMQVFSEKWNQEMTIFNLLNR